MPNRERLALNLIAETVRGYRARHPELDHLAAAVLTDIEQYALTGLNAGAAKVNKLLAEATKQVRAHAAAGGDLYLGGSGFPTKS